MSEIKLTKGVAQEIKSALQAKVDELKEFGLFLDVGTLYYNDDSFCVYVSGTNTERKFVMQKGMKMIH